MSYFGTILIGDPTTGNIAGVNSSGQVQVTGGTQYAEGATPSASTGNAGLVKYNSTPPSVSVGAVVQQQGDIQGNLKVYLATLIAGEDLPNNVLGEARKFIINQAYSRLPFYSVSGSTLQIKNAAGLLGSAYVDNFTASLAYLQVYNQASGAPSGTPIFQKAVAAGSATNPGALLLVESFFGPNGLYCSAGVLLAVSSVSGSYTGASGLSFGGTYV